MLFEQITFIGTTLGPLYLEDPGKGAAAPLLEALAGLDSALAAQDWPFVEPAEAAACLAGMQQGLKDQDALLWEWRRLFGMSMTGKPAPLWASYYLDREGSIVSEYTLGLRRWLSEQGIGAARNNKLTPEEASTLGQAAEDHLGQMLVLLGWIAAQRPELTHEFLQQWLLPWSGHVLKRLAAATEHGFYKNLAILTAASLSGIEHTLAVQVEYPHFYR